MLLLGVIVTPRLGVLGVIVTPGLLLLLLLLLLLGDLIVRGGFPVFSVPYERIQLIFRFNILITPLPQREPNWVHGPREVALYHLRVPVVL
jgi:hypothetical protein